MSEFSPSWICCQLGAREHYAIPRAVFQTGQLAHLITDAWVLPSSSLNRLPEPLLRSLRERFHEDLAQASIRAFTRAAVRFEMAQRLRNTYGWQRIIARNHWFQKQAVQQLASISHQWEGSDRPTNRPTLFAYSYAALEVLYFAKARGWRTILGQIDPGPLEEKIVLEEHAKRPEYKSIWQPAPASYWANWQQECLLADHILVNSLWSAEALKYVGIPAHKIEIVPLAYSPSEPAQQIERHYPSSFSVERPLRVLFLGQVILRKGIAALLEAADLLRDQPVEFWIVGSQGVHLSSVPSADMVPKLQLDDTEVRKQLPLGQQPASSAAQAVDASSLAIANPNVRWIGSVTRSATAQYYRDADVFLFPTLSDGFGLTQLEAQSWKLPLIASRFCGAVVKDQMNGLILSNVTGDAIAQALRFCLHYPHKLEEFARQSTVTNHFNLLHLQQALQALPD